MNNRQTRLLERAAELIANGWCRNFYARDKNGKSCDPLSKKAKSFCAVGAIHRARHELQEGSNLNAEVGLDQFIGMYPPAWNDDPDTTQNEVVMTLLSLRYSL